RDNLNYAAWRPIEDIAPPLKWWRDWDKCERLRAALLDKFIECEWRSAELLKTVKTADTLDRLFDLFNTSKARKRLLRQTAEVGLQMDMPQEYRRILKSYK